MICMPPSHPKKDPKKDFPTYMKETLHKIEQSVEDTVSSLNHKLEHVRNQIAHLKLKIWQGYLILTLIIFLIGTGMTVFGTYSKHYTIKRVTFTTEISYNQAIAHQNVTFHNVSILPEDLEIINVPAYLITPANPKTTPMPGIVWSHGMVVNKEINLHNALELAVAGFKVLAIDLTGHGGNSGLWDFGLADLQVIWSAVEYMASLPDVNPEKVAVAGHSNGGISATRAGIFDDSVLGTGGKIKAVCAVWTYSDLEDTLKHTLGIDPIDDPEWGDIISTFFGCTDGVITATDNAQRSVIDFINQTNVPNYLIITGAKDQLTNTTIQFSVFEKATNAAYTIDELDKIFELQGSFSVNNTYNEGVSFSNGTARKLCIRENQDHITEVMEHANMDEIVEWLILSLDLIPANHLVRSDYVSFNVNLYYYSRIVGGGFIVGGMVLLLITLSYLCSERFFPKTAACLPQFIPLFSKGDGETKEDKEKEKEKYLKLCDEAGRE
ncbi:MAG: alpha/beta fold hydrolase, partial [Promethearchaeota archaeon]